jgi:hypothetical protein
MHFKYPAIFYFLFILIVPILIHLFNLKKFKKIEFTNVQFLKKISIETRKSSQVKKLLILATRLLCFTALIFTFSQPYLGNKKIEDNRHYYIYLDNSESLNTNGNNGNLLKTATHDIIENSPENERYSLLTNDDLRINISKKELKKDLRNIQISNNITSFEDKINAIERELKNKSNDLYKILLISDFQYFTKKINNEFTNVTRPFSVVKLTSNVKNNISVDSVYISTYNTYEKVVSVVIKNQGDEKNDIPIALYNSSKLINKRSFSILKNEEKILEFPIENFHQFKGKIQIDFNESFMFDNVFYFTINSSKKTSILTIGKSLPYISKIFNSDEFDYSSSSLQNLNYNSISSQQLIILNQIQSITKVLESSILKFIENGGNLLVIPNKNIELNTYNSFFKKINSGEILNKYKDSLKITTINFEHPLFRDVFTKEVRNFEYPAVALNYTHNLKGNAILMFENKTPFLHEVANSFSKIYLFSSPLDIQSSNIVNSPIIVPTLYNMAKQSLELTKPYYILQKENTIEISKKIEKNEILKISNQKKSFIPSQINFANKVVLSTINEPKTAGFFDITLNRDTLNYLAYNNSPNESLLTFYDLNTVKKENKNITIFSSIKEYFKEINEKNKVQSLWRLFLAIAIVSLLLEILILKFFST